MGKKLTTALGLVVTILIVVILLVVVKNEQNRRVNHAAVLAEVQSIISLVGNTPPSGLCELEQSEYQWEDVDYLLRKAMQLETPILLEEIGGEKVRRARREVAIRYVVELLSAFRSGLNVSCNDTSTKFGRNSYTLLVVQDTMKSVELTASELGLSPEGLKPLAIQLIKEWIAAGRPTKFHITPIMSVEYLAGRFGISTTELGLTTAEAEEIRKYYRQLE